MASPVSGPGTESVQHQPPSSSSFRSKIAGKLLSCINILKISIVLYDVCAMTAVTSSSFHYFSALRMIYHQVYIWAISAHPVLIQLPPITYCNPQPNNLYALGSKPYADLRTPTIIILFVSQKNKTRSGVVDCQQFRLPVSEKVEHTIPIFNLDW